MDLRTCIGCGEWFHMDDDPEDTGLCNKCARSPEHRAQKKEIKICISIIQGTDNKH